MRERKYFSGCKCGICAPMAHKFCAQQTASLLSETPSGVFDRRKKSLTLRRQAFLYAENRFPGDESQRGLVVIHILLVQSTSQFSSPSRRQSLPRNNPRFAPAFRTMFVALENAKTSLFLALVRKVFLLVPLILLLPLILPDPVVAVYLAEPITDTLACTATVTMFVRYYRKYLPSLQK